MKRLLFFFVGVVCSLVAMGADNYTVTATRTLSSSNKKSVWTALKVNNGTVIQGNDVTASGEGLYFESKGAKIQLQGTTGSTACNVKSGAIMYVEVPSASSAGKITLGTGATDRKFTMPSGNQVACNGNANFTSSDIVNVNNGYYVKLTSAADCKFGTITIELTSSDSYVSITKLSSPTLSSDGNGKVTISGDTHASCIVYTTNGTDPNSSSATYEGAFTVVEGTEVKAMCIGDGVSYSNSDVVSKVIYVEGITVATPSFKVINGTVAISCSTVGAKIKYSTDGTTYVDYSNPITFASNGTIYAKASRENCTESQVASNDVTVVAAKSGSFQKIISWIEPGDNNWEYMTADAVNYGIKGKAGSAEDGWSVSLAPNGSGTYDKAISGRNSISIDGNSYATFAGSNGRQLNVSIPDGFSVNRITIYGINNGTPTKPSIWSDVAGVPYTEETQIPFAETDYSSPYVRVFPLDDVKNNFTLCNNGAIQQCFVMVIDYNNETPGISLSSSEITVKASPYETSKTATVRLEGVALTVGSTVTAQFAENVEGLSINPSSVEVDENGIVDQEFTIEYAPTANVDETNVNLVFSAVANSLAETVVVTYGAKLDKTVLAPVSGNTTWAWSELPNTEIQFSETTTPTNSDEFVFADVEKLVAPASFKAASLSAVAQYAYRNANGSQFMQGTKASFVAGVPGKVTISYANTGNNAGRSVAVNGIADTSKSVTTNTTYATSTFDVPAGLVEITGCLTATPTSGSMLRIKEIKFETRDAVSANVEITNIGYATYYNTLPMTIPAGVTAYTGELTENSTLALTAVENVIPGNTAVVLEGEAGSYTFNEAEKVAAVEKNDLKGTDAAIETSSITDGTVCVLGYEDGKAGFYKFNNTTLAANKAYLVVPAATAAKGLSIVKAGEEATGINTVSAKAKNGVMYNIAGQRVNANAKGLVIVNGKVVNKK